jgi:hypothetical protein
MFMPTHRLSAFIASIILAPLFVGCGEKLPEFGPVEGIVRIKGKPKSGILVRFLPDPAKGNDLPINASGLTDASGKYQLRYAFKELDGLGAPVGWHRVVVEDSSLSSIPQGAPIPPRIIPIAYNSPATTPLAFEVKAEPQTIDLEIP